jgi:hypothetical protein
MRKAAFYIVLLSGILFSISLATAQTGRARLAAIIQARVEARQPMQIAGESITLTGDTLRVAGRALIRFNDTSIRAEEVVVHLGTRRIDLVGNASAFLGSDVAPPAPPPIEFR